MAAGADACFEGTGAEVEAYRQALPCHRQTAETALAPNAWLPYLPSGARAGCWGVTK